MRQFILSEAKDQRRRSGKHHERRCASNDASLRSA